jgi:hypothetical protein
VAPPGLAPSAGQLGAAGFGYYALVDCWSYQLVDDRFGNYPGQQPANICLDLPPIGETDPRLDHEAMQPRRAARYRDFE